MSANLTELREVTADEMRAVEGGVDITPFLQAVQAAVVTNTATTGAGSGSKIMAKSHEMKLALISNFPR